MSKEATKKFVENNGFICKTCAKVIVDGHKHENEEDLCDQCKISDLESKLEKMEKEKELDNSFWKQECDSLQKALANKEKKIEKLKSENHALISENAYQEADIFELNWFKERVNQDKISFAVEQLEKVKEFCIKHRHFCEDSYNHKFVIEGACYALKDAVNEIDNQIKAIKEGK